MNPQISIPFEHCVICNTETKWRCMDCVDAVAEKSEWSQRGIPYYCSFEHQQQDWTAGHKVLCARTQLKMLKKHLNPTYDLFDAIRNDLLPARGFSCYKPFGFANCQTEQDEGKLLGVYIGLVQYLHAGQDELNEAQQTGTLPQFIVQKFVELDPTCRGLYYPWLKENMDVIFPMK